MVRISKLTDYALVIMAYMAEASNAKLNSSPNMILQARDIAEQTHISLPTVSKLLKILTKHQFLNSVRGTQGGYQLAMAMEKISIVDLIQAMEGPLAITECNLGHQYCSSETQCAIRTPWLQINQVITETLSAIKLSDLIRGKLRENSKNNSEKTADFNYPLSAPQSKSGALKSRKRIPSIPVVMHSVSDTPLSSAKVRFARDTHKEGSHGL